MSAAICFCSVICKKRLPLVVPSSSSFMVFRHKSKAVVPEDEDPDKPIRFSTSEAGWNYRIPKDGYVKEYPVYKQVILWGTFFFYVHYFMFYRPPNDIDEELSMPLGKRFLWIQELHLLDEKKRLESSGNSASSVDEELKRLDELRKKYNYI